MTSTDAQPAADATSRDTLPDSPILIAEIGCNHAGDLELAKKMMRVAAEFCEVDVVKFQKRNPRELLSPEQYDAPHPNAMHSFGASYGLHREALEFTVEQHAELAEVASKFGVTYATSVWDMTSARDITDLNPALIKIPSATNTHTELLAYLADHYGGRIHVSLGMTTPDEEKAVVELFRSHGRMGDLVLYACTSGYPVPFEQLALREITRLVDAYGADVHAIAYSGHHLGIAADVAAMTLGARYVERHFTLDRTAKGTDHSASLEPDGMRKLRRDLTNVSRALTYKSDSLLPVEHETRAKLKWQPTG